ncbi:MAG: 50S ribosomal protein L22 [Chitinophagaceae bacterium]|nr:50S ribosomal protein L22 [Chitinophagaceae bacterium]
MEARAAQKKIPTSPRKMRLIADTIRGKKITTAINILKHEKSHCSISLEKTLMSAMKNWEEKNPESLAIEENTLFVKEIYVDSGKMLKRLRPATKGRGFRIRKRSNHLTIVLESMEFITEPDQIEDKNQDSYNQNDTKKNKIT